MEGADAETAESVAKADSAVKAVLEGSNPKDMMAAAAMNPQHLIVSGLGTMPADSVGNRWTRGDSPDWKGKFEYVDDPKPEGEEPNLDGGADKRFYGTSKQPQESIST